MSSFISGPKMFTTSTVSNYSSCAGVAATDIIETTSVGVGTITSGMVVTFYQSSGGTVAAGITSGNEYLVVNVTAGTSSFQLYATQGSTAVDITADSTGTDYYAVVQAGNVLPVKEYKYVTVAVQPTSGYDGEFRFVGSMNDDFDPDGRLTSGNFFYPVAYEDTQATSNPILGSTYVNTTGGTSTSWTIYKIDTAGLGNLTMRTRNFIAGSIIASTNLYKE